MNQSESDNSDEESPLMFSEGVDVFSIYQKQCSETFKSRSHKRKERVLKSTDNLFSSQQKKLKREEKRKLEKQKRNQIIQTMTKEETREYLYGIKKGKIELKAKVRKAMGYGQVFMVDLVYQDKMNEKENKSLAKQIELIMRVIKRFKQPPSIHLCNFGGGVKQQMQRMEYQFWAVTTHEANVTQVGLKLHKKLVYLSPDAPLELHQINKDYGYIIGGLVDRSILKNASLKRAEELGIQARRLPIAEFMTGRLCLNLDHVINMICKFVECKDWKEAFNFAAPKRWKKEEQQLNKEERKPQLDDQKEEQPKMLSPINSKYSKSEQGPNISSLPHQVIQFLSPP